MMTVETPSEIRNAVDRPRPAPDVLLVLHRGKAARPAKTARALELFLDREEAVVLGEALAAAGGAGLDQARR